MISDLEAFDMLTARLNAPAKLARLRAVKEIGKILSQDHAGAFRDRFFRRLRGQILEIDVVTDLAVVACSDAISWTTMPEIESILPRPSIASDIMLGHIFGQLPNIHLWEREHSGASPEKFVASNGFFEDVDQFCAPFLYRQLRDFERVSRGVRLVDQWAWEVQCLREKNGYRRSSLRHFARDNYEVVSGFECRYGSLYWSAYLRMIHFAKVVTGMPSSFAERLSRNVLPVDLGLLIVEEARAPARWPTLRKEEDARRLLNEYHRVKWLDRLSKLTRKDSIVSAQGPLFYSQHVWVDFEIRSIWDRAEGKKPGNQRLSGSAISDTFGVSSFPSIIKYPVIERGSLWSSRPLDGEHPAAVFYPLPWPRWQAEVIGRGPMVPVFPIPHPPIEAKAEADAVRYKWDNLEIASWNYWRSHWRLGHPRDVSWVGSTLRITNDVKDRLFDEHGWILRRSVTLTVGEREDAYREFKVKTFEHCMDA